MYKDHADPDAAKQTFWKELSSSPFVMLQLDGNEESTSPMTAQTDKDANSAIWFFMPHASQFATGGPANASYTSKGHDLFARFQGVLTPEPDAAIFDKFWTNTVEAWFPEGKSSARLMRMDLGDARIWDSSMGPISVAKMFLGMNVHKDVKPPVDTQL